MSFEHPEVMNVPHRDTGGDLTRSRGLNSVRLIGSGTSRKTLIAFL